MPTQEQLFKALILEIFSLDVRVAKLERMPPKKIREITLGRTEKLLALTNYDEEGARQIMEQVRRVLDDRS